MANKPALIGKMRQFNMLFTPNSCFSELSKQQIVFLLRRSEASANLSLRFFTYQRHDARLTILNQKIQENENKMHHSQAVQLASQRKVGFKMLPREHIDEMMLVPNGAGMSLAPVGLQLFPLTALYASHHNPLSRTVSTPYPRTGL